MSVDVLGVSRRFGTTALALDAVDLSVRTGEFVALLGPSGSGKTTLLRILAGLDFPDAGDVRINGRRVAEIAARHRGIGFVFQHYALFRHMTVFENVAFGLEVRPRADRPHRSEIAARVRRLLELVQIPELERRYPDQISGGQRQRVALARALATEPSLLLLDEPFGALDAQVRKDLRLWLRGLHEQLGITSLFVTHDQDEAMEIANRIAIMRAGRVVQFDEPGVLLDRPADAFVAGFLGETNRLHCTVSDGLAHFGELPLPPLRTQGPDGPAVAFIRPCDLIAEPSPGGHLDCAVHAARHDGRTSHLLVMARGVILDGVPISGWTSPRRGEPCRLRVQAARVFPAHAGGV